MPPTDNQYGKYDFFFLKILFAQVIVMLKKNWMFTWTTPLTRHSPLVTSHLCYNLVLILSDSPPHLCIYTGRGLREGDLFLSTLLCSLYHTLPIPLGHLPASALISLLHSFKVLCHMSLCNFSNLLMKFLVIISFAVTNSASRNILAVSLLWPCASSSLTWVKGSGVLY